MDSEKSSPIPNSDLAAKWRASGDVSPAATPKNENSANESPKDPAIANRWRQSGDVLPKESQPFIPPNTDEALEAALENTPEEIKNGIIFGKSIGELWKGLRSKLKNPLAKRDLLVDFLLGATVSNAARAGLTMAGVQALPLAVGVGVISGGVRGGWREYSRQNNELWQKLREEKATKEGKEIDQVKLEFKEKLKNRKPIEKANLAWAIGKGAAYGGVFGALGFELATSPIGQWAGDRFADLGGQVQKLIHTPVPDNELIQSVGSTASRAGEAVSKWANSAGKMVWDKGYYIEPSKYMDGPLKIPDNVSEDWLKYDNIHNSTYGEGKYVTEIANAVGVEYSKKWEDIVNIAENSARQHRQNLSLEDRLNILKDAQHVLEVAGNRAFDSNLESVVNGSRDLNEISELGNQSLNEWVNSAEFQRTIQERADQYFNIHDQLAKEVVVNPNKFQPINIHPGQSLFEQLFPNVDPKNPDALRGIVDEMGAEIAINQDILLKNAIEQWKDSHHLPTNASVKDLDQFWGEFYFPAYLLDLEYLMQRAKDGDQESLMRLYQALDLKLSKTVEFKQFNHDLSKVASDELRRKIIFEILSLVISAGALAFTIGKLRKIK